MNLLRESDSMGSSPEAITVFKSTNQNHTLKRKYCQNKNGFVWQKHKKYWIPLEIELQLKSPLITNRIFI